MYLFFDTETTGIPLDYQAPVTNLANWPRVVQLAWVECEKDGTVAGEGALIVRPQGFTIPADAARVHGITTERAKRDGVPLKKALAALAEAAARRTVAVAHNMSFDGNVLGAEFLRAKLANPLTRLTAVCTMLSATDFCALPGKSRGFKWPRLDELHKCLFGRPPAKSHDAVSDVRACVRCFFELKSRGIIR